MTTTKFNYHSLEGPKDTVDIEVKENVLTVKSKKLEANLRMNTFIENIN